MKKNILKITLSALIGFVIAAGSAFAATDVSLIAPSAPVTEGRIFTVTITLNPAGIANYTTGIELSFPQDLIEVRGFTFASGWLALNQPGYDVTDNQKGSLVKTAGFPGGFTTAKTFGTISFLAKKSGAGQLKIGANSFSLDANNANVLNKTASAVSLQIAKAAIKPSTNSGTTPVVSPTAEETITTASVSDEASGSLNNGAFGTSAQNGNFMAMIGNILSIGTGNMVLALLIGLIIASIVGYEIYQLIRLAKKTNVKG